LKSFGIFCTVSALFIFSMFYRLSSAVIAPDLIRAFGLNAESLGVLGGAFFYSFALMQIPMGVLLDRIGPRYVMSIFGLVGALGAFIFAVADTFFLAILGRILIGTGMASVLMGSLKVFVLRFSQDKFSILSGILISVGALGSILAASPLAWLTITIGWRMTFVIAACITAASALLVFFVMKDSDGRAAGSGNKVHDADQKIPLKKVLSLVLGSLSFWQISAFAFFRYGTFVALQGLWLGTYLIDVKGFSPIQAGNILVMLSIGYIAGAPIAGYLADRVIRSAKMTAFCFVAFYVICLLPLTGIADIENPVIFGILFSMLGFFNSPGTLAYTHVKELFPIHLSGTVIAAVNFFVMAGGAILTPALGMVIENVTPKGQLYSPAAYHLVFLICFLGTASSLVFYAFSKSKPLS
jgi:sugar phosphate permease